MQDKLMLPSVPCMLDFFPEKGGGKGVGWVCGDVMRDNKQCHPEAEHVSLKVTLEPSTQIAFIYCSIFVLFSFGVIQCLLSSNAWVQ